MEDIAWCWAIFWVILTHKEELIKISPQKEVWLKRMKKLVVVDFAVLQNFNEK